MVTAAETDMVIAANTNSVRIIVLLYRQDGVQRRSCDVAARFLESRFAQQGSVFGERALAALRADQHVQRLHMRREGAAAVLPEQPFGDQQPAAGGQGSVDASQQPPDLFFVPIVEDAADRVEVRPRQLVLEEITGDQLNAIACMFLRDFDYAG